MSLSRAVVLFLLLVLLAVVQARRGWTGWLDRDNPSGTGDWETVSSFRSKPCGGKAWIIQARIRGSTAIILQAYERLTVGPNYGLLCSASRQADKRCYNYYIQFAVPYLSQRFNRNLVKNSDCEFKSTIRSGWKNGRYIIWGSGYSSYGYSDERLEIGPRYGLSCRNAEQRYKRCKDYQVRFYCLR